MAIQEKLITAEEFAAIPDDGKRHELVRGVIVEMVRPKPLHGKIQIRFGHFLDEFVDAHDLGLVTAEAGFLVARNPDVVRGPDVAFISKKRLPNPDLAEFIPMAPDLAIEIVSPNDTVKEVHDKIEEYFRAGGLLVWVVYPESKRVHVYSSIENIQVVNIDGTLDGGDVLPGFILPLRDVFKGL